jgi:hypothetical protein
MYNDKFVSLIMSTGDYLPYAAPFCFEMAGKSCALHFEGKSVCELNIGASTLEFCGETFDCTCTKCSENVYLIGFDNGGIFLDAATGRAALAFADRLSFGGTSVNETVHTATDDLAGWKAALCFAPGLSVTCKFGKSCIRFEGGELDAEYVKAGDTMYLVSASTSDGRLVLVFDTARFLFYGFLAGKTGLGGYIESVSTESVSTENISK